ncbi:hypothetical protein U1Q18_022504 [Sarracenia purpurea var. burkii]
METSYSSFHHLCTTLSFSIPNPKPSSIPFHAIGAQQLSFPLRNSALQRNQRPLTAAIGCAKGSPVTELKRESSSDEVMMMSVSGEDEWAGIGGKWREKCEQGGGIVELLECLEREAIMGEDEGREATDYDRRARIFDKSSRVFQALKERNSPRES